MADDDRQIDDLAGAVLDGDSVDWTTAESHGDVPPGLVKHLRFVATVGRTLREDALSDACDPAEAADTVTPRTWGHLRIVEHIGRGAYGDVFRAWDTRLEREVALKLIPSGAAGETLSATLREARLLARVRHPNVVTIFGADRIDGRVGLWMELVRGRTLHYRLANGAPLESPEVTRIGLELARALAAVHAAGLLHRDIKAQNVMLADDGRVVLMDFGAGHDLTDTRAATTGTPLYLAPEIFRGQPATPQTDIYSLGVLLFHLLTRRFPVEGTTMPDLRLAHEGNGQARLRTTQPGVPSRLARVIDRAIEPRPEQRYATATAMAGELEAAASQSRRWFAAAALVCLLAATGWCLVPERPVIAILPFANHVAESGDDLLSEGFVIELSRGLAEVEGLGVRSAISSLAYKGRPRDIKVFGRELGVTHLLEGSMSGEAGTIHRINASLVRIGDEETIWARSFVLDHDGVFDVQNQIVVGVVNGLRLQFPSGQRSYRTDPTLHTLFYEAQAYLAKRDQESRNVAVRLFEVIKRADPEFMPAEAGLARALLTIPADSGTRLERLLDPKAEALAVKVHDENPSWADAQAAMGLLCAHKHEWDCAVPSFERALELDPDPATLSDYVFTTLLPLGEAKKALRLLEDALEADRTSVILKRALAHMQIENGQYDRAIETARDVVARDPALAFADISLGRALYLSGQYQEALEVFKRPDEWMYRAYIYAVTNRKSYAEALLADYPRVDLRHMLVYSGLGDPERAFDALERMVERNPWRAVTWMQRPEMVPLRGDSRYDEIRNRLLQPRPLATAGGAVAAPQLAPSPQRPSGR